MREGWRKWLADREWMELLDIGEDLMNMIDYRTTMMDEWIDRRKFGEFMKKKMEK